MNSTYEYLWGAVDRCAFAFILYQEGARSFAGGQLISPAEHGYSVCYYFLFRC